MERQVGGGIGMGNTCKPMAVSCQCMAKTTKQTNKTTKKEVVNLWRSDKTKGLGLGAINCGTVTGKYVGRTKGT